MIFRRIKAHIEKENWFAVFIDFAIVVVGVFIGIQVANWNEHRVAQDRSQSYLVRLNSDFLDIQVRLKGSIEQFDESLDAIKFVRAKIEKDPEIIDSDLEKFRLALNNIDATSVPAWQSATYTEMQSAGVLDLIGNEALKAALVGYDQVTQIAYRASGPNLDVHTGYIEPILYSLIEYDSSVEGVRGTDSINVKSYNYEAMRTEPEFRAALSALVRAHSNNRILQANQLNLAQETLAILSEEIK